MWPALSITKPEPSACCDGACGRSKARARGVLGGGVRRGDLDDAGSRPRVDLADGEPLAVCDLGGGSGDRGGPNHGGRATAQVTRERRPAQRDQAAEEGCGGKAGCTGDVGSGHAQRCSPRVLTRIKRRVKPRLRAFRQASWAWDRRIRVRRPGNRLRQRIGRVRRHRRRRRLGEHAVHTVAPTAAVFSDGSRSVPSASSSFACSSPLA